MCFNKLFYYYYCYYYYYYYYFFLFLKCHLSIFAYFTITSAGEYERLYNILLTLTLKE